MTKTNVLITIYLYIQTHFFIPQIQFEICLSFDKKTQSAKQKFNTKLYQLKYDQHEVKNFNVINIHVDFCPKDFSILFVFFSPIT